MNARFLAMIAGLALIPSAALAQSEPLIPGEAPPAEAPRALDESPAVEVVFVLDTTGSMSGLIEGAKAKIWSIANAIATAEPRPRIRMGLVGYRDRGDAYITRLTPLTDDLDAVYGDLMGYTANGGGDTPESVNQALHEAVTRFEWSGDATTLRLIYLVGDAPPHMDYEQDVRYPDACELAAKAGIIINTIQCGNDAGATPVWQEIARSAEGEYFAIDQSGGTAVVATPFDSALTDLSRELDATIVLYGETDVIEAQTEKLAAGSEIEATAGLYALADRAAFRCRDIEGATFLGQQELVADCLSGKVKLEDLPKEQLPESFRGLTVAEMKQKIEASGAQREHVRRQMVEISQSRDVWLAANADDAAKSFDRSVLHALQKQALRIGLRYSPPSPPAEAVPALPGSPEESK